MPTTLRSGDALTRLKDVQPQMARIKADSSSALIDVNPAEILDLIQCAMRDVGLKQEAAAARAGVKSSQFSAALNGHGNFGATWLWVQDERFLARLVELVQERRHLTPERVSVLRRQRIVELIDLLLTEVA